jgi:hypothetical protein
MALKPGWLGVLLFVLALPLSAAASLGNDVASVRADQKQLGGRLRTRALSDYTELELQTPSGTRIRQYLSSAGVVFAVVWQGPALPDLRQILGRHFGAYVRAADGGSHPREHAGLVVQAGGHMRAFLGRAWVPELMPKGVNLEQIR